MIDAKHHPSRLTPIWRRIDRIYCITLADRPDRRRTARDQFARVGLDQRVAFHTVQRHPDNAEQGIFESHRACLAKGLAEGARHVLIFEDDVVFGPVDPAGLAAAMDRFTADAACSLLLFGGLVARSRPTDHPAVRRVRYRCLAHAYTVKAALARQLAGRPWQGIPIDALLRDCTEAAVALYPSIAFQSGAASDNANHRTLDAVRRLCGGLRLIQKVNERYHRFRGAVVAVHLLLAGAIILWIVMR